ncbi:MAG: hypothetical protein JJE35_03200 [Thermoleophilia bacterium]|nr:hypothetical protein [Thermoleophilia bacterium]
MRQAREADRNSIGKSTKHQRRECGESIPQFFSVKRREIVGSRRTIDRSRRSWRVAMASRPLTMIGRICSKTVSSSFAQCVRVPKPPPAQQEIST